MDLVAGRAVPAERRPIRHLDPVLVLVAIALVSVGLLLIYSATHRSLAAIGEDPGFYLKRQAAFAALGVVLALLVASVDYRFFKVYAGMIYLGSVVLLILVRTPLGTAVKGSQRWFEFFGFQLTPSEVSKIALIIMLAAFLSELHRSTSELALPHIYSATAIAGLPALLVFLQPDLGTSIVLASILVGMLVVAGARARHLAVLALTGLVLVVAALQTGLVREYQLERVRALFDPANVDESALWNRQQAEIAIGSGGLTGLGYLRGSQTNLDFVPEQHTDFIFTVVGEEFGFVGTGSVLLLFALLLWRALRISALAKDPFGTYVAAGIAAMLAIQMFVNVGMTIGIMPITGIPLPFLSYGGSALLTNAAAVGLLLNIHMRRFI
ncbi:MAG: rod shape-determining protein RodA [Actinomycetota bacterium]|nr:MAG: rod shape-determining protein RodA [Actinomycetota bacterium]